MKKITAFVESGKPTEVLFDEPIVTGPTSRMIVKNVTVFWRYANVVENNDKNDNNTMTRSDNTLITFDPGFWTFDEIKKYLKFHDIDIERTPYNGGCKIQPHTDDLLMNKFAPILGFPEHERLTADVWETSPYPMDVYRGLRWIDVRCDIANEYKNYDHNGRRSNVVITLPVPTDGNLMGAATTYDIQSGVTLYNGVFNRLEFSVGNNTPRLADVDVLLEAYIA